MDAFNRGKAQEARPDEIRCMAAQEILVLALGQPTPALNTLSRSGYGVAFAHEHWIHYSRGQPELKVNLAGQAYRDAMTAQIAAARSSLLADTFNQLGACFVEPAKRFLPTETPLLLQNWVVQNGGLPPQAAIAPETIQQRTSVLLEIGLYKDASDLAQECRDSGGLPLYKKVTIPTLGPDNPFAVYADTSRDECFSPTDPAYGEPGCQMARQLRELQNLEAEVELGCLK